MKEVRVLLLPHFEIGELTGDFPGEAQLFYEEYLSGGETVSLSGGTDVYYNGDSGVAMALTGAGKVSAALTVSSIFSSSLFDLSSALIFTFGCAGGAAGVSVPGDVCLATGIADWDIGHTAEGEPGTGIWYPEPSFASSCSVKLNSALVGAAYELIRDCCLETTETTRRVMAATFPGEAWAERLPRVITGSSVTGDCFWKGRTGHERAALIAAYYGLDTYTVSEMEDISTALVCSRFGASDRLLVMRVNVNSDLFLVGTTPESLWTDGDKFVSKVSGDNAETLDIFLPAMRNLFTCGKKIIDAALRGAL